MIGWLIVRVIGGVEVWPDSGSVVALRSDRDDVLLLPCCCNHYYITRYNCTFQSKHIIVPILIVHFILYASTGMCIMLWEYQPLLIKDNLTNCISMWLLILYGMKLLTLYCLLAIRDYDLASYLIVIMTTQWGIKVFKDWLSEIGRNSFIYRHQPNQFLTPHQSSQFLSIDV